MVRSTFWFAAGALVVGSLLAGDGRGAERRPNVVFLIADDLGYGDLGCFGQTKIRTPHIDQLAKEGMRLTQHYSGNAVCAPSRCVLMTGKHTGHSAVRSNKEVKPEGQHPLPAVRYRSSNDVVGIIVVPVLPLLVVRSRCPTRHTTRIEAPLRAIEGRFLPRVRARGREHGRPTWAEA